MKISLRFTTKSEFFASAENFKQLQRKTDEERLAEKFGLARRLLSKGYKKKKIRKILDFIKYYVQLQQPEKIINFDQRIFKNKEPMGITEGILAEVKEKAIQFGKVQGISEGIEKGIEQGISKGKKLNTIEIIQNGYAKGVSIQTLAEITGWSVEQIQQVIDENN